jgi:acyl phosphate:glycerol-3-phosphate acyltransferase
MIAFLLIVRYLAAIIIGYLLGSIPFGLILGKAMGKVDVREWGSGAIGATNVARAAGVRIALLSGALDFAKGTAAVFIARWIVGNSYIAVGPFSFGPLFGAVLAGLAAVVGHSWSIYLKFHGGRSVAVFFGGLVALVWFVALFGGEVLALGATSTLFMSLGSLAGVVGTYAILIPLTILNGLSPDYLLYTFVGTAIIIYQHRSNIVRLFRGIELKLGQKAEKIRHHSGQQNKKA